MFSPPVIKLNSACRTTASLSHPISSIRRGGSYWQYLTRAAHIYQPSTRTSVATPPLLTPTFSSSSHPLLLPLFPSSSHPPPPPLADAARCSLQLLCLNLHLWVLGQRWNDYWHLRWRRRFHACCTWRRIVLEKVKDARLSGYATLPRSKSPLATDNLLENTDGVPRPSPRGGEGGVRNTPSLFSRGDTLLPSVRVRIADAQLECAR